MTYFKYFLFFHYFMDIDLYEFKETLKKFEEDEFIQPILDKQIAYIEVGKTSPQIDKKLLKKGYKKGDRLLVVIQ